MSVYSASDSAVASSSLEFDFDDIIVNSQAYRRALAAIKVQTVTQEDSNAEGDLIDFSDAATIKPAGNENILPELEDLVFATDFVDAVSSRPVRV